MDSLRLYVRLIACSLRGQLAYRATFLTKLVGNFAVTVFEFLGIWALFTRFGTLGGWTLREVALLYGTVDVGFALADMLSRGFDRFGTILKAGERSNIIPEDAEATFSLRIRKPEEREQVLDKLRASAGKTAVPDTKVTVLAEPGYPPLMETADVDALADRATAIYAELGKTVGRSGNGGASESAVVQSVGTPALDGLGLVGGDFHTDHEWVDLNSLAPRLYLITRLLMETGANPPRHAR